MNAQPTSFPQRTALDTVNRTIASGVEATGPAVFLSPQNFPLWHLPPLHKGGSVTEFSHRKLNHGHHAL